MVPTGLRTPGAPDTAALSPGLGGAGCLRRGVGPASSVTGGKRIKTQAPVSSLTQAPERNLSARGSVSWAGMMSPQLPSCLCGRHLTHKQAAFTEPTEHVQEALAACRPFSAAKCHLLARRRHPRSSGQPGRGNAETVRPCWALWRPWSSGQVQRTKQNFVQVVLVSYDKAPQTEGLKTIET